MNNKNISKRIFRKTVKLLSLQAKIKIDGYLTKKEEKEFNLNFFEKIDGWFSAREGIALFRLASNLPKNSIIVEIGAWKGKSTYSLACGIDKSTKFFTIDPFDASGDKQSEEVYDKNKGKRPLYDQFAQNMKKGGVFNKI